LRGLNLARAKPEITRARRYRLTEIIQNGIGSLMKRASAAQKQPASAGNREINHKSVKAASKQIKLFEKSAA